MIISILYVLLAILGLSFLVFIHELGHYYMARRVGMRVETFSIGFGKPIYSWMKDHVQWQIGWLPFGGYVKIVGLDAGATVDPYEVQDGFFGKKPLDRIKVALMGPLVNIVFAMLVFLALWGMGGRNKPFNEYTHKIGWVDPKSELYANGIRPGDEIIAYGNQEFQGARDHLYAPMTAAGEIEVHGNKVDLANQQRTPFNYKIKTYPHPAALDKDVVTAGILQSASYLVYDRLPNGKDNPLPEGSPMQNSGIQYGDRIIWVDGEPVYSLQQLLHILNDSHALVSIKRGEETFLRRVPRVRAEELKLDPNFKEELVDWQFEAQLNGTKIQKLYAIPYNLDNEGVVEAQVKFIDKDNEEQAFPKYPFSALETPLEVGDKIVAVDGIPVTYSFEILSNLQKRHVNMIVERNFDTKVVPSWQKADILFNQHTNANHLQELIGAIGLTKTPHSVGNLYLLNPVEPKKRYEFNVEPDSQAIVATELAQRKEIESIEDPEKRKQALHQFENRDKELMLGLPLQDQRVSYNPSPLILFSKVFEDIWHTLGALFTGSLNPKWMSGPIGIVQAAYDQSMVSLKEAFFLLGVISLNLGVLNLLPLPVLDGGTICFALYEMVTGKRLKSKTMERLIIPFALVLIGFFVFLTYHDLARLLGGFLR